MDIRALSRRGNLRPGIYSWNWSRGDEPAGSISARICDDHVELIYTWTPYGSAPLSFDYPVWIERTACHYGGSRTWFRCPRCRWRCAVIYGVANDGRFGCRRCMHLAYSSEAEDPLDRLWRKQRKLEGKLDENRRRARGMRQRTYERILEGIGRVEEERNMAFNLRALVWLGRLA